MTDIDKLKDDVIAAARDTSARYSSDSYSHRRLRIALTALDEAQKPDPWKIIEELSQSCYDAGIQVEMLDKAEAALAWRKENPDE